MKEHIFAPGAPKAIGPYSHAVKTGNLIYCSGQTPIDPETNELVNESVEKATARVLDNLQIVLKAAGSDLSKVVKSNVYLKSMDDFKAFNGVYGTYFPESPPARTSIQAGKLPLDAFVEIEVIAEA